MGLEKVREKLKKGEPLKIVALGDSLTQGWMVRKGYLDYLAEMLEKKYPHCDVRIINGGQPGDTAEGGLYRLNRDVVSQNPDLVFIQFALNDAFLGIQPDRFSETLALIIKGIRVGTSAEMLLLTSVPVNNEKENRRAEEFYDRITAIAERENLPIVLVHRYWMKKIRDGIGFDDLVIYDMVHPNEKGYRLMAEAVMEVF